MTMTQIAEGLGVSQATVSLVYNRVPGRVSEKTRMRVLDALKKHGYVANVAARGLRKAQTYTLLLHAHELTSPWVIELARTCRASAAARGYMLVAVEKTLETHTPDSVMASITQHGIDGVLWVGEPPPGGLQDPLFEHIPVVAMGDPDRDLARDLVCDDEFSGTYAAARHVVGLGHKRIAIITGSLSHWYDRRAFAGLQAALGEARVTLDLSESVIEWDGQDGDDAETGERAIAKLLENPVRPTAVLVGSDHAAAGVIREARRRGIAVPEDLSVIGKGNYPFCDVLDPPLSSIESDHVLGVLMAETLIDRIEGRLTGEPRRLTVPQRLILRKSTAPPRS